MSLGVRSSSACPNDACLWTKPGKKERREPVEIQLDNRDAFHVEYNIYLCTFSVSGGHYDDKPHYESMDICEEHAATYFPDDVGDGGRWQDEAVEQYLVNIPSGRMA